MYSVTSRAVSLKSEAKICDKQHVICPVPSCTIANVSSNIQNPSYFHSRSHSSSFIVCEQCKKAADRCPEQEPVPEEAGAAADQRHGGVYV